MITRFRPDLIKKLKKQNVRIRKSFKEKILIFGKNPHDPQLNNHSLRKQWLGYRSINITNDYRAVYTNKKFGDIKIAYFVSFGTHNELYQANGEDLG